MPRELFDYERRMGETMGALPGMAVVYEDCGGEIRCEVIDYICDFDGWKPPAFMFDAEVGRYADPQDILAVVLPGADPAVAMLRFEAQEYERTTLCEG